MDHGNEGVARFSKAPTTIELRVMYFIEHTYMVVRKHPFAINVVTFLFFIFLYLNTIISFLAKEEKVKLSSKGINAISFITSLNFINSDPYEVKVSLIFVTLAVFTIFSISIFSFSVSIAYRHVLINTFQIMIIYLIPPLFIIFVSVFQHSYMTINNNWSAALYFGIFGHSLFIFIVTMTALFSCMSPYICNHPFFQRNFLSASVTLFYIVIISHLDCYFFTLSSGMQIARVILSFLFCIFILVMIPYYNRNLNAALFSFTFFNFLTSLTVKVWPNLQLFCLIYIPISLVVTAIIFYIIFPLYFKKWYPEQAIFFEFFLGHFEKAFQLLDQIQNPSDIDSKIISNVISIAFHFHSTKLPSLLQYYFSCKKFYVGDMIHMWIILHLYNTGHHGQTPIFSSLIETNERKINRLEEEFWYDAWLSDVTNLPIISSSLGRKMMNMNLMIYQQNHLIKEAFPNLTNPVQYGTKKPHLRFEKEFKLKESQSTKYLFKKFFRFHEIILVITIVLYAIYMIFSQIHLTILSNQSDTYRNLIEFTNEFYSYHLKRIHPPEVMYEKFNETISTELRKIYQFYTDTGFISKFENYYRALVSTTNFPVKLFKEFVDSFSETLYQFLGAFQPFIDSTHKKLRIWYIVFLTIFSVLAVIPPIISYCNLNRKMVKLYEKFRIIPKNVILKIGNIDPHLSPFDKHWVNHGYSVCKSYPLTLIIIFIYFLLSSLYVFITYNCATFGWNSLERTESSIYAMSSAHRIPINLVLAAYSEPTEAVNTAQQLANDFLSDHRLYFMMSKFPQSFYDLIGSVIFNPNITSSISTNETSFAVDQICDLIIDESTMDTFTVTYQYQRVCFYIVELGLFTFLVLYIIIQISPISNCEVKMGEYLYMKIRDQITTTSQNENDSNESLSESIYISDNENMNDLNVDSIGETELDDIQIDIFSEISANNTQKVNLKGKWSIDDVPIVIIIIDDSFELKYQTKLAKQITQIEKGENFRNSNLDHSIIFDIEESFKNYQNERGSPLSIPFGNQQSLIIYPFYKTKKLLDYIMVVESKQPPNASIQTLNKLNHAFYSIYPKIIPLNQTFPFEIQSNGRPFFILFIQLIGFNEWCDKTDLIIVEKFRKDISKIFDNLLMNESNFCRVRESSDLIVIMMNRETKLSIWKILEACSEFGNNVLEMIQKLTSEYNASSIHGCVLLFKIREPNYYFTSRKCIRTDFKGDSVFSGESRLINCKPEIVNYTSQKKELKVSNTTKLKTCYTPNGEEYELLIVV